MNRGKYESNQLVEACRANDVTDFIVLHETRFDFFIFIIFILILILTFLIFVQMLIFTLVLIR